jgi:hypothetical protein
MISKSRLETGDLVTLLTEDYNGMVGVVSQPIAEDQHGHVLVQKDGYILGVRASIRHVIPADRHSAGFAQLAYNLIQLGSHVIEARLIV